jgi:hypothetical protein
VESRRRRRRKLKRLRDNGFNPKKKVRHRSAYDVSVLASRKNVASVRKDKVVPSRERKLRGSTRYADALRRSSGAAVGHKQRPVRTYDAAPTDFIRPYCERPGADCAAARNSTIPAKDSDLDLMRPPIVPVQVELHGGL